MQLTKNRLLQKHNWCKPAIVMGRHKDWLRDRIVNLEIALAIELC